MTYLGVKFFRAQISQCTSFYLNMEFRYIPIFALVGVLVVLHAGMPLLSSGFGNYAYARYATDAQSLANNNECNVGTNCANPSSQSIGDGTANTPVNTQISDFVEEQVEEEPPVGAFVFIEVKDCTLIDDDIVIQCTGVDPPELEGKSVRCISGISDCIIFPLDVICRTPSVVSEPQVLADCIRF